MPGLSSVLKGPSPWGSQEPTHTLCPAPVSALHLTPLEGGIEKAKVLCRKKNKVRKGNKEGKSPTNKNTKTDKSRRKKAVTFTLVADCNEPH